MTGPNAGYRAVVPVALLLTVGGTQLALVRTSHLTPWKGGGFGMFSTLDDASRRYARVFVEASDRSEELEVPPSLEVPASALAVLPSHAHFERLAVGVVARERRYERPVERVRIEVWRYRVDRATLAFVPEQVGSYSHVVTP